MPSIDESSRSAREIRGLFGLPEGGADLNLLLDDLTAEVEPALTARSIRVFKLLPPDVPNVGVDALELRSVFRALFEGASQSLQQGGGTITCRSWEDDGYVCGCIADDGPGLTEAEIDSLFNGTGRRPGPAAIPGSAASQESNSAPDRWALDLRAARGVVARHGGRLEAESRPGLWTRFTVILPTDPSLKQSPKVHDLPASIQVGVDTDGGLTVLVVDDNHELRSVVKRFLERRGHTVTEAENGNEALILLRETEFDRVLVDIDMPGKCGKELFEDMKGEAPRMRERTIFMSGAFYEGGVDDFIVDSGRPAVQKPFDLVEMARTVEE